MGVTVLASAVAWSGCVGTPPPPSDCVDAGTCGTGAEPEAATPETEPVADPVVVNPVREPDTITSEVDVESEMPADLVWVPWLGWGQTVDLLDLLATGGLADDDPVTANPGSFTTLERLCLTQDYPASYCRSRYGSW